MSDFAKQDLSGLSSGKVIQRLKARWFFPIDKPPIENATLVVDAGKITDITTADAGQQVIDLGNRAVIPGLINAHAHLEFASLQHPIKPALPFTHWIRALLRHRSSRSERIEELVINGLNEASGSGTTTVGEIATSGWDPTTIQGEWLQRQSEKNQTDAPSGRIVAFRECIGLSAERQAEEYSSARAHIFNCRKESNDRLEILPAISPHAPYSVAFGFFIELVQLAKSQRTPLCIHLAETESELQLLEHASGEFREMLTGFGIWNSGLFSTSRRPLDYLTELVDMDSASIAHGNNLAKEEIDFLGQHPNIAVAYCPRTHHFFGHKEHPWRQLLEVGATVSLGTDGRSSNPDYSLWREMQFLDILSGGNWREEILKMGTVNGARTLGMADRCGTLKVGQEADLSIVRLPTNINSNEPYELLFNGQCECVVFHGRVTSCAATSRD